MRDWLGKPLLILAGIILVLGAISLYWLSSMPSAASGGQERPAPASQRRAEAMMRQMEHDR